MAPSPGALALAEPLTDPARWAAAGADERALWGRCRGSGREPYDTVVDHVGAGAGGVGWRCSCPSRKQPCKHALGLLLRWARGDVPEASAPPEVARWIARRAADGARAGGDGPGAAADTGAAAGEATDGATAGSTDGATDGSTAPDGPAPDGEQRDQARDERVARMRAGLVELDRWLDDRLRTGLADPALARYATWDDLAARLVDARAGALANRIRRLAGLVGASPDWHDRVLAEMGVLHLLAQAGLRLGELAEGDDAGLADRVATAVGWQVRRADVLAGVPETDDWVVAGRSDTREDRIEVRRVWLWGRSTDRWAMVLSFAAYGQGLDDSLEPGTGVRADIFRYPGGALRALVGDRHGDVEIVAAPRALDVAAACDRIGRAVADEPWLERLAVTVRAAPTVADGRWVLTDRTGSLPLVGSDDALATLVAASVGDEVPVTVEWTPYGVVPLAVHLADRTLDVGPRADPSFVAAGR